MASSPTQGPTLVQAIYSFKGKNNDELCFKKGDIITVTQKEDGGWWEGTLAGTTGWFPSNYVKEHKAQDNNNKPSPVKLPVDLAAQQKVYRNLVLKDLIDSEKANVAELQTLITNFLHPLEKSDILNRDEYRQLVGNIDTIYETHSKLLIALEACNELPPLEQRVGKLFLTSAPQIKQIHLSYCSSHPRAICILNKHKDALNIFMESQGAASPGLLVLTTGLSKPFRRLEKYSGILQELKRHMEENHPDRGDTQRSVSVYKDIWSACSTKRRQKEQELEILTGGVIGWEGEELSSLGEIIHMGSVAVGPEHQDRYLVLFPSTLLMLSVSSRMSGFIYEGKLPLSGINVMQLPDSESYKNAFEVTGALIDRIVAVCQTKEDQQSWVDALCQAIRSIRKASVSSPNPPPHVSSQFTCPYTELTSYFASLVKSGVITRALLKRLLYRQCGPENVNIIGVKVRRNQRVECVIFPTKISFSAFKPTRTYVKSESTDESGSTSPRTISTLSDGISHILRRQDAVDCDTPAPEENPYGYIKYFSPEPKRSSVSVRLNSVGVNTELSGSQSAGSSFDVPPKPIMLRACEDLTSLVTLDQIRCDVRGSLPAPLTPDRHSDPLQRSASADPGILPTEERASDEVEVTRYHFTELCECCEDLSGTPRSSDSGLADITSTCTITLPDLPQPWTGMSPTASLSHNCNTEFEEQCSYHSVRTSAPPFITSDVIFVKDATGPVIPLPTEPAVVYRSGMYAHWWMKTHIPAAAVKLSPGDDKEITDEVIERNN
ncbi:UNVERIFIED_CONTAM: hypothetical protein PYX00_006856 [Menopon gallinae]|uniref:Rho guanine nucleotide exchange factor 7 n=1 Tax=Menopon gallinae TaxID=328185 RepID=A0AAW2HX14_9NEOP